MRYFQSKNLIMGSRKITMSIMQGMPSNVYPNSDLYCYHDFYEFEYFEKGYGIHYINGVPYQVKGGYAYLLFPGDGHHIRLDESVEYKLYNLKLDINVPQEKLIKDLQEFKRPLCVYFNENDGQLIKSEIEFLRDIIKNESYNSRMKENISERILNLFLCALEKGVQVEISPPNEPIWKVVKYIENNFSKQISLAEISKVVSLSENYISTYFKKNVCMSFIDYLNKTRLFYAARLLKDTDMSVKQIAIEAGFNSPEYFARLFKAMFSKSPKEYRK